ncbi:MAG: hypoxanthine phosphoribosyltransferase [Ruminococcaceae bacterium]|nr:hypoxanthine phosphoribosyltransferase [Oscillospiraceae bacterium]
MISIEKDIERVLISETEIAKRVKEMAAEMDAYYKGEEVVLACILKGAVTFFSDLVRLVSFPVQFDFMCVSSYGSGTSSSGSAKILKDLSVDITGKNLLLVEDILDSGNTMSALIKLLSSRNPKDIKLCCLLNKPSRRVQPITADFSGFDIPDEFVVGYGLDYDERYRQLPYVGVVKPSVYKK